MKNHSHFASMPVWGVAPVNASNYSIMSSGNTVTLQYSAAVPTVAFTNVGGKQLQFAWTGTGSLECQTNGLSVGWGTNWVDYLGSSPVTVPVNPANGSVFFRVKQ